jgi:hypothetical protein
LHSVAGVELPRIDQRTWTARRIKHLVKQYVALLGGAGALTELDRAQIRQAVTSQIDREQLEVARLNGADVPIDDIIRAASEARRAIALIEARAARAKPAAPNILDFAAELAAEAEAS